MKKAEVEVFVSYHYETMTGEKGIANGSVVVMSPPETLDHVCAIEIKIEDEHQLEKATIITWKVFNA